MTSAERSSRWLEVEDRLAGLLLEAAPDGTIVVDDTGTIVLANRRALALFGFDRRDLLGLGVDELLPVERRDVHAAHRAAFEADPQARAMGVGLELEARRADGSLLPVEISLSPVTVDGRCHTIASVRDISQRVASERALQRAHEALMLAEDRERIARDLHDTVIQRLFASGLALQAAEAMPADRMRTRVNDVVGDIDTTIRELRAAIFGLQHDATEPGTLARQVNKIVHDAAGALGFAPAVSIDGDLDRVPARVAEHVLPVLREAMANTARHARPTRVVVRIAVTDDVAVEVSDDGVGIAANALRGNGLQNMTDRALALGGTSSITSRREGGTNVRWQVPLRR